MSQSPCEAYKHIHKVLDSQPIIVSPQTLVIEAVVTMSRSRSSYLLVGEPQQLLGIVTEQDLVKLTAQENSLDQIAIAQIISQEMSTVSLQDSAHLCDFFSQLHQSSYHYVPVIDDQGILVGMVTPQSLRHLLQPNHSLLTGHVAEILSPQLLTASPHASILEIAQLMTDHEQSCIVLGEQINVADCLDFSRSSSTCLFPQGVITAQEIVQCQALGLNFSQVLAKEVMSNPLPTIYANINLWQAHQTMEKYYIRHLVVTDEWGYLAGIVTQNDLVQSLNLSETDSILVETNPDIAQFKISQGQPIQPPLPTIEAHLREQIEPQTQQLQKTNLLLREEIQQRIQVEAQIRRFNEKLEREVKVRTEALEEEIHERKLMEKQLRTTESKMRAVFEAMTDIILILDDRGQHLEIMPTGANASQAHQIDLINLTIDFLFQEEENSIGLSQIKEALATQKSIDFDYCLEINGKKQWFTARISPLSENLVIWVARDITQRKRTEEALQLSEEKFSKAFRSSPNPIAISTFNGGRVLEVNDSFLKISGYTRSEVLGHTAKELNAWVHPQKRISLQQRLTNQEVIRNLECQFRTKFGTIRTVLLSAETFKINGIDCILCISNDITERKQAEESLRLIVEGTAATTGKAFFKSCVRYLAEVLQVEYALVTEFVPEYRERVQTLAFWAGDNWIDNTEYPWKGTPCGEVLTGKLCYYHDNVQGSFPTDQELVDLGVESYLGMPLKNTAGEILGHLAVLDRQRMKDNQNRQLILRIFAARTGAELERQQTENALKVAKQEADQANKVKSEFLANMSHELRTPLNGILGFTDLLLRDSTLSDEQQSNLKIINNSGTHLLGLINDILDMSKIEADRVTLNENCFDFYDLLTSLQDIFRLKAESKGLTLHLETSESVPQYLKTDEGKLRQILTNLIGNAVKFTDTGGIWIRAIPIEEQTQRSSADTHILRFEIEDTGPGISPEEQEDLFTPFVQTKIGRESQNGTGLGLSISRRFVQLMGGEMSVQSTLGQGTTFSFEILVSSVESHDLISQELRQVEKLAPNQPIYRILIAEDRWESRLLLKNILQPIGFEVQEACNGKEAIALWQTWEPHLIWMDMQMPVMDGYAATQYIKSQLKGQATVIIALTASALEQDKRIVLSSGCDDFVRKPFQASIIFDKIAQYLGVRYIYQKQEIVPLQSKNSTRNPEKLQPQELTIMPQSWIEQLFHAAMNADEEVILQLIEKIPSEQTKLAQGLMNLVYNFRYDTIMTLTESFSSYNCELS